MFRAIRQLHCTRALSIDSRRRRLRRPPLESSAPTTTNPAPAEAAPVPTDAAAIAGRVARRRQPPLRVRRRLQPLRQRRRPRRHRNRSTGRSTIPAGTNLAVDLRTTVASDASHVEDPVRGTLRHPVMVSGVQALAAGSGGVGPRHRRRAIGAGQGQGGHRLPLHRDRPAGRRRRTRRFSTATILREASATKKKDAAKIGGGAAGGALIGAIIGGGDGAAKGAAIGGAAGTGVVLATRGKEISVPAGTPLSVRLTAPLTVRVLVKQSL